MTFAGRYTIIKPLGAGGMAAVYQAWDETLGMAVALKLIRADETIHPLDLQSLQARFKRELKLARQISHPNVIRIHDLGEVGKTLYITMALVQGSDLAQTLLRLGRLPIARVLTFARQIASGLKAAHDAGIVHRDLKPANILIDGEDRAFLTDFGIARSTDGATMQTMPGALVGTLEYMAPEQARGEAVTERTDIYSFGLILYEMLVGGRPKRTGTGGLQDLIARIESGPPALNTVAADIPADLESIVARCLERDPAKRYQTTAELLADLESLDDQGRRRIVSIGQARWKRAAAALLTAAVLVGGTWWTASKFATPAPALGRAPVTVLIADFENRSGEQVFDGALEQALSVAIEGASFVSAYPRSDAARLTRDFTNAPGTLSDENARLVALREGIQVVLAGAIASAASGYELTVRQFAPGSSTPPQTVTERANTKGEVLTAVGRLAERIRRSMGDDTDLETVRRETFTAANFDAVRAYTTAQQLSQDQKDVEAITHYRKAIAADPDFGRAYAGLAASLSDLGRKSEAEGMWKEALSKLARMTEREKLRTLGGYYVQVRGDYDTAIDTYRELVTKYPADSAGHNNLAVALFGQLDFAGAQEQGLKAIRIYPRSFKYRANYALYAMYAGDVKTATDMAGALIKEDPKFETAYLPLAMSALLGNDTASARRAYAAAAGAGSAGVSLSAIGLADIDLLEGKADAAIAGLRAAITRDRAEQNDFGAVGKLVALAEGHLARNELPAALSALKEARALSDEDKVLVAQARLAIRAKRFDEARRIAQQLAPRLQRISRAYGLLIEGEIAAARGDYATARDALARGIKLADLWALRYALGHAYFAAGSFVEASQEFEKCEARRGEATALFLDDLPTYRYAAELPYWLGRAKEALGNPATGHYETFIARRADAKNDPLVEDARRRAGSTRRP